MTDDLRRRLEALADRGEPRGADAVLAAARRTAATGPPPRPPLFAAAAVAAAALAVLGVTAVVVERGGDGRSDDVAGPAFVPVEGGDDGAGGESATGTVDLRGAQLASYSSCRSLVDETREKALERVTPHGVPGLDRYAQPTWRRIVKAPRPLTQSDQNLVAGSESVTATEGSAASSGLATGPSDGLEIGLGDDGTYSETNTQEAGIDEPDIVDTDGRRLLTLRDGRLWYATVVDGEARIESSIELLGATEFVLVGDRAVVFGVRDHSAVPSSTISVVDVRTPQMGVVASLVFDGAHVSARVVDGVVRAVVRSAPAEFEWYRPVDSTPAEAQHALGHNREILRRAKTDQWLPDLVVEDGVGGVRAEKDLVDCDATYHPQAFSGFGLLTVLTIDPANPDATSSTSVQADGQTVYASRDRLYVATTEWPRDAAFSVPTAPAAETLVHSFDISGRGQARYTGSGRVPGQTIGQFAFSEHDGHLRVASTVNEWAAESESVVTVLRPTGKALEPVGRIGGLGRTEQIYAVRFIGPMGYVVTFRRTDPLYVLDLRNPRHPRLVGELKVPGYSAYLHPIGDGLLLGVGQDATEQGRITGLQVSVFDVSDPTAPKRLHQRAFPLSSSVAEVDHHAFLWWAPARLAVLPVGGRQLRGGAVGLTAGRDKLDEVGRVEHPGGRPVERSVVVGSTLFTVSRSGILAAAVRDLEPGKWSPYPPYPG